MLQCAAVLFATPLVVVLQYIAVCCSAMQCVAVCFSSRVGPNDFPLAVVAVLRHGCTSMYDLVVEI